MRHCCIYHPLSYIILLIGLLFSCSEKGKDQEHLSKDWKRLGNPISLEKSPSENNGRKTLFTSKSFRTLGVSDFEKPLDTVYVPMITKLFEQGKDKEWGVLFPNKEDTLLMAQGGVFSMAKTRPRLVAGHLASQGNSTKIVTAESINGLWTLLDTLDVGVDSYNSLNQVKLSEDGNTLAVFPQLTSLSNPSIQVYERFQQRWHPKGKPIIVKDPNPIENSGVVCLNYVALSQDGSKIAFGNPFDDVNGQKSGSVKVYAFDSDRKEWTQEGDTMYGDYPYHFFGISLSFSLEDQGLLIKSENDNTPGGYYFFEFHKEKWKRNVDYLKSEKHGIVGEIIAIHENAKTLMSADVEDWYFYDIPKAIYLYERVDQEWKNIGTISEAYGRVLEYDFIPSKNSVAILFNDYPGQKIVIYTSESH